MVAIVSAAVVFTLPAQTLGCSQTAHYALVRALLQGTAVIDEWADDTCDIVRRDGHVYANKAPGLAFWVLPVHAAGRAVGIVDDETGDARRAVWLMTLWGSALPALLLLVLAYRVAGRLRPGAEWPAALTLGAGTMLLPFATVLFGHALTTLLVFAAFAIALAERQGPRRLWPLAVAGLAAGLSISVEYPTALAAAIVGVYAIWGPGLGRRIAVFGGGALLGVAPAVAYQVWAFGSPFETGYSSPGDATDGPAAGHAAGRGFFGLLVPSLSALTRILFSDRGLLILTPVLVTAVIGAVVLWRRGARAEVAVIGAVSASYLLYVSSLTLSPSWVFGGDSPGPRYVFPMLPFLAVAVGVAFRHAFAVVAPLLAVSVAIMTVATLTVPLVNSSETGLWWDRLSAGELGDTALALFDGPTGLLGALPLIVAMVAGIASAVVLSQPPRPDLTAAKVAAVALLGWLTLAVVGPVLTLELGTVPALTVLALAGVVSVLVVGQNRDAPALRAGRSAARGRRSRP